jgi:hypothetical protein
VAIRLASILLAALALALAASPSAALARSGNAARSRNAAATRAYIQANYLFVRAARANLSAGKAALNDLVGQVAAQCPLAAAESPQNHESEQLSDELVGAMTIVAFHPDVPAIAAFARAVGGLRWSDRALTRTVRTYAARLQGLAALALPEVCADVQAWTASGFRTVPASTVEFQQSYDDVDVEAEEVPLRLLAPYESAREASLLRRTKRLEAPLAEAEADSVADFNKIMNSLGLSQ